MDADFEIDGRKVGPEEPVYVVAELSANHGQNYDRARDSVKAAAEAGADAVKLQTYTADTLTIDCDRPEFHIGSGTIWDGRTLYNLYEEAFTPWEWQPELRKYALDLGIGCFTSPFDIGAVEFLEANGFPAYKIASFEIVDLPLINCVSKTDKPVIISTGMSTLEEIQEAFDVIAMSGGKRLAFLKCTSAYPSPPEEMNLRTIPDLSSRFGVQVGLSDHTLGSTTAIAAVAMGATILEKHFTLSRALGGPDSKFSLEPGEFKKMVEEIRAVEQAMGTVKYSISDTEQSAVRFRRSLFAVKDIKAGEVLTDQNIRSIRPADGMHTRYLQEVIGRTAKVDIMKGMPLNWSLIAD
ncbi:MAG: Pseudaminic acid synthase [Alphaproteobacteria bacterium MarineAlpha3_Bin5]|nr:pseudaminic acid synthase [Magnetovibrio sp.]PPR78250.1 MAG: Pseudaminic acid synthase [Alphaproteobacteria bacterium MarineAlpha3_Bin5]